MARTVQDAKLAKREQRLRLQARKKPYWMTLNEGEHLGYYRGARVGKWVARYRQPGAQANYQERTLAEADDTSDADGCVILDFRQAQAEARKWFAQLDGSKRKRGVYTVADALDDYVAGFRGKDLCNTRRRIEALIRPQLGKLAVAKVTSSEFSHWLHKLADSPARLRTAPSAAQNVRLTADNDEARRRRRSSANRVLTILKAALNAAYRDGKVAADDAWRRVKPYPKADSSKLRYLSEAESRRLVNAADRAFRPLLQAALLTGARYSELANLETRDFDRQARIVWLRETKSGSSRAVYLEAEGVSLFENATAGKQASDFVFVGINGRQWGPSQQARPLARACAAAKLERTTFHDLRRTFGARLALSGVPLAVIAEALGHADERVTRKHYAHLCKSYVADTVRAAVTGFGLVRDNNVVALPLK